MLIHVGNRRSSEIQGTALGKSLRAWTCIYRSMPAGVADRLFSAATSIQGTSLSRSKKTLSNYLRLLFPEIVYWRGKYNSCASSPPPDPGPDWRDWNVGHGRADQGRLNDLAVLQVFRVSRSASSARALGRGIIIVTF